MTDLSAADSATRALDGRTREICEQSVGGVLFVDEACSLLHDYGPAGNFGAVPLGP